MDVGEGYLPARIVSPEDQYPLAAQEITQPAVDEVVVQPSQPTDTEMDTKPSPVARMPKSVEEAKQADQEAGNTGFSDAMEAELMNIENAGGIDYVNKSTQIHHIGSPPVDENAHRKRVPPPDIQSPPWPKNMPRSRLSNTERQVQFVDTDVGQTNRPDMTQQLPKTQDQDPSDQSHVTLRDMTGGSQGNAVGSQNVRSLYDLVTIQGMRADSTNPDLMKFMEMYRQGENHRGGLATLLDPSNQLRDPQRVDGLIGFPED